MAADRCDARHRRSRRRRECHRQDVRYHFFPRYQPQRHSDRVPLGRRREACSRCSRQAEGSLLRGERTSPQIRQEGYQPSDLSWQHLLSTKSFRVRRQRQEAVTQGRCREGSRDCRISVFGKGQSSVSHVEHQEVVCDQVGLSTPCSLLPRARESP